MLKTVIRSCYIIGFIFNYNLSQSQTISVSTGTVVSYAIFHNSTDDATLVDTINGQYRSLVIDTVGKMIEISWQIEKDTFKTHYFIEKIYMTENFNSTTKKYSKHINLMSYDDENYPMLIMVSIDLKTIYLYYYWNNKANAFLKSEKVAVTTRKKIVLN